MKLLLISCLFLISCAVEEIACEESDAIIENICVYKNGLNITDEDLRRSLNIINSVWSEKFGVGYDDIIKNHKDPDFNTQIEFVSELEYKGFTYELEITLKYNEILDKKCLANTAIGHEMLHLLGTLYKIDFSHENKRLFINQTSNYDEIKNSLENILNVKLCNIFCEEGCIWYRIK